MANSDSKNWNDPPSIEPGRSYLPLPPSMSLGMHHSASTPTLTALGISHATSSSMTRPSSSSIVYPNPDPSHLATHEDSVDSGSKCQPPIPLWFFEAPYESVRQREVNKSTHGGSKFDKTGQKWIAFSLKDNYELESVYSKWQNTLKEAHPEYSKCSVLGTRYNVNFQTMNLESVYWEEQNRRVLRATWFYMSPMKSFLPYCSEMCEFLENTYQECLRTDTWHRPIAIGTGGEHIVIHSGQHIQHFLMPPDSVGFSPNLAAETISHGRLVVRSFSGVVADGIDIPQADCEEVDHLVFVVHGIGSICDLKMRNVIQCVNHFRNMSNNLVKEYWMEKSQPEPTTGKNVSRVEFIPIEWHSKLHGEATGVDKFLKNITLPSIPKIRDVANDVVLDVLFYTSPSYCQTIVDTVAGELNRVYKLFCDRCPKFSGKASLVGHSLGSLILFDILNNQKKSTLQSFNDSELADMQEFCAQLWNSRQNEVTLQEVLANINYEHTLTELHDNAITSISHFLQTPNEKLMKFGFNISVLNMFFENLLTSIPNGMSMWQRKKAGQEVEGDTPKFLSEREGRFSQQSLPYVASKEGVGQPAVQYPDLHFKPNCFFALGSPIAMFLAIRGVGELGSDFSFPTCPRFLNIFHPFDCIAYRIEPLIRPDFTAESLEPIALPRCRRNFGILNTIQESAANIRSDLASNFMDSLWSTVSPAWTSIMSKFGGGESPDKKNVYSELTPMQNEETPSLNIPMGKLNEGRRVDYVLQESILESVNQYLFAILAHTCYWDSEDVMLMILIELYAAAGLFPKNLPTSSDHINKLAALSRSPPAPPMPRTPPQASFSMHQQRFSLRNQGASTMNQDYVATSSSVPDNMVPPYVMQPMPGPGAYGPPPGMHPPFPPTAM